MAYNDYAKQEIYCPGLKSSKLVKPRFYDDNSDIENCFCKIVGQRQTVRSYV